MQNERILLIINSFCGFIIHKKFRQQASNPLRLQDGTDCRMVLESFTGLF